MTATSSTNIVALTLESLDVLFFRDGRPFGAATRASSGQPMPQTMTGVICTALLQQHSGSFTFAKLAEESKRLPPRPSAEDRAKAIERAGGPAWVARVAVRGPWLARVATNTGQPPEVLVPVPSILHVPKKGDPGDIHRLAPLRNPPPGWKNSMRENQKELYPLGIKNSRVTEPATGYLTHDGLKTFLSGGIPANDDIIKSDALFTLDHRTGIEISPDQLTAKESMIYGASFLALRTPYVARELGDNSQQLPAVVLYVEVELPVEAGASPFDGIATISLGGEGRHAKLAAVPRFEWPKVEPEVPNQRPLLLQTTPGIYEAGWLPACLRNHVVAAAVPDSLAVSGWDLARRGPKPTRFAAAAGSVYFMDTLPNNLPNALSDDATDRQQGWGCFVQGVWNDE